MIKHFYSFAMLYRKKKQCFIWPKGIINAAKPTSIFANRNFKWEHESKDEEAKKKKYKIIVQEFIVRKSERIQIRG